MKFASKLRLSLAAATLLSLAGCNGDAAHQPFTIPVTTPNGEPLPTPDLQGFDSPGCPPILATWFDRIDTNHDGVVDRAEFMADAEAQFARMDLNHTGTITPALLQEFRASVAGHGPRKAAPQEGGDGGSDDGAPAPVQVADALYGKKSTSLVDLQQGGGYDRRAEPDPVMSADTSLRFRVTKQEFMDQAARRFARLDIDRSGRLTKSEAMRWCLKGVRWPEQAQ
jgi:hypothetical protein